MSSLMFNPPVCALHFVRFDSRYYVAHAWEADFFGLVAALENHCKSVVAANPGLSPADILYWLDIFALNQSYEVSAWCVDIFYHRAIEHLSTLLDVQGLTPPILCCTSVMQTFTHCGLLPTAVIGA